LTTVYHFCKWGNKIHFSEFIVLMKIAFMYVSVVYRRLLVVQVIL